MNLRNSIVTSIDNNIIEEIGKNAVDYYVPLSVYPQGDPCNSSLPLHILSIASQKRYIGLYSCNFEESDAFNKLKAEYFSIRKTKSCVGKGCIRFDRVAEVPFDLISDFVKQMSLQQILSDIKAK